MEARKIEVTPEMLEQALLCCATDEPADHYPCEDCYLNSLRDDESRMPDGIICNKRLAKDAIAHIRQINGFQNSQ